MENNTEVDINVLVSIYNNKISTLTNQNILLEAKLQTLQKDYENEKNLLLVEISQLKNSNSNKIKKKSDEYQESGVVNNV